MNKLAVLLGIIFFIGCNGTTKNEANKERKEERESESSHNAGGFFTTKSLPKKLKEISGLITDGAAIWAISDNPKVAIYKLDTSGNVLQQITVTNIAATDVEAVAADAEYLYIGDIGDNNGTRDDRLIMKIKKSTIGNGSTAMVTAEKIAFSFPDEISVKKKKKNNFDAEAMFSYKDSLYVFTKRRGDDNTELMVLSKKAGTQVARPAGIFNSKGLVTDAAINKNGTEVALIGYENGHEKPFVWLLNSFAGTDFFSGKSTQYQLANRKVDWQTEGITFYNDNTLVFSCEETKDFPASLFIMPKANLDLLNK